MKKLKSKICKECKKRKLLKEFPKQLYSRTYENICSDCFFDED